MKYEVAPSNQFKRDVRRAERQGRNIEKLIQTIVLLAKGEKPPKELKDHALKGNYSGYRELHIESDWLLIYKKVEDTLILALQRTGSHSELLKK